MSYYNSGNFRKRGGGSNRGSARDGYGGNTGRYGQSGHSQYGDNSRGYGSQGRKAYGNRGGIGYGARGGNYGASSTSGRPSDANQIWMGDLDPAWTEDNISSIWAAAGEKPVGVKIMSDRNNSGKPSYCFVTFESPEVVTRAMTKNGTIIPGTGQAFKLNYASGGGSRYSNTSTPRAAVANENSIFIGDLGSEVTDQMLLQKFNEKYPGQIRQVKVMIDLATKQSKGFGFVRFYSADAQKRALAEMNGVVIGTRPIRVGLAAGSAAQLPSTAAAGPESTVPDTSRVSVPQTQPVFTKYTDPYNTTVVIRGLSGRLTPDELALHMISYGDIIYSKLDKSRNSGYVKFYLRSSAEKALLFLQGTTIGGHSVKVTWGNDNEARTGSTVYLKSKEAPLLYGKFGPDHIRFDTSDEYPATVEESENLAASNVNQLYVQHKLNGQNLIETALY